MKKIIIILLSFLLLVIVGLIALISNKDKVLNRNNSDSITDYRFYDKIENSIDYNFLLHYLCYNNNYNNVPVTNNYKSKFKQSLSELYNFEVYNTEMYNYELSDYNQMLTRIEFDYDNVKKFCVELLILKKPSNNHPKSNRKLFFYYTVDDSGFVDDIEFIKEEVYREDDGTPIIRPNNRKFDISCNIARYLENLVYGFNFIKYKNERGWIYYDYNIEDIEWEFKEYALTNNLKKNYDLNEGLIPDTIKQWAYKYDNDITLYYPKDIYMDYDKFPKERNYMLPVKLYYDGIYYDYNLLYSITDDMFLDNIVLEKK